MSFHMEREKMEAWADALLDQHRTAPKPDRDPVARLDPVTRMMVEAGAAPMPDPRAHRPTANDPDAWMGRARAMAIVLAGVLVLGIVLALVAG